VAARLRAESSPQESSFFLDFWRRHGEPLLGTAPYHEVAPHLVLMAYRHRVVNGGTIEREYAIGSGRMDPCLRYAGETLGIEIKVWRPGHHEPRGPARHGDPGLSLTALTAKTIELRPGCAYHAPRMPRATPKALPKPAPRKLPAALAKRAEALAQQKRTELAARGREDIAFIRQKQTEIVASFYDIGVALNRLNEPGIAEALGFSGFGELVEGELGISAQKARDLMGIARFVRREDALRWGQEKSAALVELVQATAAADSPASLAKRGKLKLGAGRAIDVEEASASAIQEAAKEARAARAGGGRPKRGVSVSAEERKIAELLQGALRRLGEERARVTAVARAGAGADLRIERVAASALAALAKAVAEARKPQ
jgi:hypothetical protein